MSEFSSQRCRIIRIIVCIGLLALCINSPKKDYGNQITDNFVDGNKTGNNQPSINNTNNFKTIAPFSTQSIPERELMIEPRFEWNGTFAFNQFIEQDPTREYFYTTNSFTNYTLDAMNNTHQDINILKFAMDGTLIWNSTWGDNLSRYVQGMYLAPNGSVLYFITTGLSQVITRELILIAVNTTTGDIAWNLTFNMNSNDDVYEGYITKDGHFLYLAGSSKRNESTFDAAIWKLNLFNVSIEWNLTWGTTLYNELLSGICVSEDEAFLYTIGYKSISGNQMNLIFLQYNASGILYNQYINTNELYFKPATMEWDNTKTALYVVGTDLKTGLVTDDLALIRLDLNGYVKNKTIYSNNGKDTAQDIILSPWNQSFYLLGRHKENENSSQGIIAEVLFNGTMLWGNVMPYKGYDYYDIYSDLMITHDNEKLHIIGSYVDQELQLAPICIYHYNLTRPPASPFLFSNHNPSWDNEIIVNWTNQLRAHNYSIYKSTTPFEDLSTASLLKTGITDLNFSEIETNLGTYYYRVVACGEFGNSTLSNMLEISRTSINTPYLSSLTTGPMQADNVVLNWTIVPGAIRYFIFRNESASFSPLENSPVGWSISNSFTDSTVPMGTWWYGVVCEYSGPTNSSLSNTQNITVKDTPAAPVISFMGTEPFAENITITWSEVEGATYYEVYRTLSPIYKLDYFSKLNVTTETEFFDDPENDFTYYWIVLAVNGSGRSSMSNQLNTTIFSPIYPPFLQASAINVSDYHPFIFWTPSLGASEYYVYRSSTTITDISSMHFHAKTNAGTLFYDESVSSIGNYYYVVVASKPGINSTISNCINISVQDLPGQVQNFKAINNVSDPNPDKYRIIDRFVNFTWSAVPGALWYEIYRLDVPFSSFQTASKIGISYTLNYEDYSISNVDNWYYSALAVNFTGKGSLSSNIHVEVHFTPDPLVLTSLTQFNRSVIINWTEANWYNSPLMVHIYRYEQPINETNQHLILNVPYLTFGQQSPFIYSLSKEIWNMSYGICYYFIAVAMNAYGYSNISNCMNITLQPYPIQPYISPIETPNYSRNITLNWTADSWVDNYYLYRETLLSEYTNISNLNIYQILTTNSFIDINVPGGLIYYYCVMAVNETGNSTPSNIRSVDVRNVPISPTINVPASGIFVNKYNLTWTDVYFYRNYSIYRSNSSVWNQSQSVLLASNLAQTWYMLEPSMERNFYYWIFAYNASGRSFPITSGPLMAYFMGAPQITLTPESPVTNHTVILSWKAINHTTTYLIYRSNNPSMTASSAYLYQSIDSSTLSFNETYLPLGRYYYIIVPSCSYGTGNQSAVIEVRVEDLPLAPVITRAELGMVDSIIIFWEGVVDATGYIVYTSRFPIYQNISTDQLESSPLLGADARNFTFVDIGFGDHYFIVVAVNATGKGARSNVIYVNNVPESKLGNEFVLFIVVGVIGAGVVVIMILYKVWRERANNPDHLLEKYI